MLKLLRERQLKDVGRISGRSGLRGILIRIEEVLDQMEGPPLPGLGSHDTRKFLRINCQTMPWLVSEGILACEKALHPRSRKSMQLFRHEVLEDFLAKYETCGRMSHRFGMKPPYVVKELAALGVNPIPVERSMSVIYRRRDLPMSYSQ